MPRHRAFPRDRARPSFGRRSSVGADEGARVPTQMGEAAVSAVSELEVAGGRSLPRAARRFVAAAVTARSAQQQDQEAVFRYA